MKELKMKIHLAEWFIKPELKRLNRQIEFSILFITFRILKKKKKLQ